MVKIYKNQGHNTSYRKESGKKSSKWVTMPSSICRRDSSWVTSGIWWAGTNAKFEFNLLIVGCRVLETK